MIGQEIFNKILSDRALIEERNNYLFFIDQLERKITEKGTNYILVQTINSESQKQKYFIFGTLKNPIKVGEFIFCHISELGDNWKIDNVLLNIDGTKYLKDLPDCKNCMWNGQAVCKQCQNGFYFQKTQKEENVNKQLSIQQETQEIIKHPEFQNEEELIEVNSAFERNHDAEEFWKEYDSLKNKESK